MKDAVAFLVEKHISKRENEMSDSVLDGFQEREKPFTEDNKTVVLYVAYYGTLDGWKMVVFPGCHEDAVLCGNFVSHYLREKHDLSIAILSLLGSTWPWAYSIP